ncbi:hypothetical protein DM01DRAFT_158802 [Hesseltinella vesiculosa]|uniref:Uncharacterized protein n=1 Tax=Hesseltinella vesiculosa TaxID=101127 RepID=A0A1X2GDU8_9FUNG|nr:hypothetical protein DM01DRAFT_158802 [Hesseltinella vesiculosa]
MSLQKIHPDSLLLPISYIPCWAKVLLSVRKAQTAAPAGLRDSCTIKDILEPAPTTAVSYFQTAPSLKRNRRWPDRRLIDDSQSRMKANTLFSTLQGQLNAVEIDSNMSLLHSVTGANDSPNPYLTPYHQNIASLLIYFKKSDQVPFCLLIDPTIAKVPLFHLAMSTMFHV